MGLFDGIKRLFGEGKVHFEGYTADGRHFRGKTDFIGHLESEKELIDYVANATMAEYNVGVERIRICGLYGTVPEDLRMTYDWYSVKR